MIYLDNNATTSISKSVIEAMLGDLDGIPRNPSSVTKWGREGRAMIGRCRNKIASYFGVLPEEVIFTSGGTESNHLLTHGFFNRYPGHIVSTQIEHISLLEPLKQLTSQITHVIVDQSGAPTPEAILSAMKPNTSFISLSAVNSETGALLDIDAIADVALSHDIPLVLDGIAWLGKANLAPLHPGIAGISFSGHKIHGPKGIGIAIRRKKHKIPPLFRGGHQERDMRAGTENLPAILGITKAIELIDESTFETMRDLRDYFETEIIKRVPTIERNITGNRISNVSNLYFRGSDAELILIKLEEKGLIASLGSACSSGTLEPSHVLLAQGYDRARASASLRFSLSRLTTKKEIELAIDKLESTIQTAKALH